MNFDSMIPHNQTISSLRSIAKSMSEISRLNRVLLFTLTVTSLLFVSMPMQLWAADESQQDVLFVVLGKTSNHRQLPEAALSLLNYHFFAEIFLQKNGSVTEARLLRPDKSKAPLIFRGSRSVLEVHGGRFSSEQALNEAYPDGEYTFSYKLSDATEIMQSVRINNGSGNSRIPRPITVYLSQDDQTVSASQINPDKDLSVSWSEFESGNADPEGIVDDLIFVVTGDCHGERIDHSGGPFGTGKYLTYASTRYVVPASKLQPGETFQIFVEQAEMDTGKQKGIPEIATYAATTFLDIQTTGNKLQGREDCPTVMPAMDGGQTDRPVRRQ